MMIAEEAIEAIGGDPDSLATDHDVNIREAECDYILTAVRRDLSAVEPVSIRISREGKVMSFPWCCPLEHCPELCSQGAAD